MLQTRLKRLEAVLTPAQSNFASPEETDHFTESPNKAGSIGHQWKTARNVQEERAFRAIETISARGTENALNGVSTGMNQRQTGSGLWPNITSDTIVVRSAKWYRDMEQVVTSLPGQRETEVLVEFYFQELQVMRKLL
jgi:hypothetical protein